MSFPFTAALKTLGAAAIAVSMATISLAAPAQALSPVTDATTTIVLQNSTVTPGAINPAVTQANIQTTICRTGFTATIRPKSSYTTALKKQQLASTYAYLTKTYGTSTRSYEEDHLISLELGGAPSDPNNLWPEPYAGTTGARSKDRIENKLHKLVCNGTITLATAQQAIATNWYAAYLKYIG